MPDQIRIDVSVIDNIRRAATAELDDSKRPSLGQYLTSSHVADFMVKLFDNCVGNIKLLDAGAGVGSLSAAFLNKAIDLRHITNIGIEAYEIDKVLSGYLKTNLRDFQRLFAASGKNLNISVHETDFIASAVSLIQAERNGTYENVNSSLTHCILNPPYVKIKSTSLHRSLLKEVDLETVNMYAAFISLALTLLTDQGELVAIVPRSFCNGKYFKSFRKVINSCAAIRHIHLFGSRSSAFKDDKVLQENVIIYLVKGGVKSTVKISQSFDDTFQGIWEQVYSYDAIIHPEDPELFVHIPGQDQNLLLGSSKATNTLEDLGIQVSTGPIVDFRMKDQLYKRKVKGAVPLIYPVNFEAEGLNWPKPNKKNHLIAVNRYTSNNLFPTGYYTLVKRFTSKEESRRVVSRVIDPMKLRFEYFGIENHLNVFHSSKCGLDQYLAYGLSAYLNSIFVDISFRSFNGHTQVNATDLKQLKYPSKEALIELGHIVVNNRISDLLVIDDYVRMMI